VLPNSARIKSSSDFARITKSGKRFATNSLVGYLLIDKLIDKSSNQSNNQPAKLGLIVGRSVGNSVVRNRTSRQIRHAAKTSLSSLPNGSLLVIRAMRKPELGAFVETNELMSKILNFKKSEKPETLVSA
jgi:ribonuclease P protein component